MISAKVPKSTWPTLDAPDAMFVNPRTPPTVATRKEISAHHNRLMDSLYEKRRDAGTGFILRSWHPRTDH